MTINYCITGTIKSKATDFLLIIDIIEIAGSETFYSTNLYTIVLYKGTPQKTLFVENILSKDKINSQEELTTFFYCLLEIEKFNIDEDIKFISGFYFDSIPTREVFLELEHYISTGSTKI
ncbi:hypothetical protein ACFFLS_06245 [Flavobacterium procerum]|uniref:Uncharacterized protein n=1 Tax=Flavobacterium procerum TaxID=1455569 RepID=A0ABV6BMG1_9FLAO